MRAFHGDVTAGKRYLRESEKFIVERADDGRICGFICIKDPMILLEKLKCSFTNNGTVDCLELATEVYSRYGKTFEVQCDVCLDIKKLSIHDCAVALMSGWPICCEQNMELLDHRKIEVHRETRIGFNEEVQAFDVTYN